MGPGLLESVYEWCLTRELEDSGHHVSSQKNVVIRYKHHSRAEELRYGLLVNFHQNKLTDGVSRLILPGANR
ncbi:GxxExxY protein [Adhaeretor mobilis]